MEVSYVTEAGSPDRPNEDYVVCGPDWIAVFDGATAPDGVDSGCVHDVRWLVRRFASAVAARMPLGTMSRPGTPLADLLAAAIADVRAMHGSTCDLANPDSPSTTVSLCRVTGTRLEYLVLADSPLVLWQPGAGARVVRDDALDHLPGGRPYTLDLVRETRNRDGGFWVASTVPEAAYHAVRGAADIGSDSELAVLTDGASRFAECFGRPWEALLGLLRDAGPRRLITAVRALEEEQPPTGKQHDDATAVFATFTSLAHCQ
ncbi:MAG TPA: protein phosphatase 2C domain-containing protein [Trebonia sp.]|jgi:hypothetical protein|nr:protein phosphatase 2C domain-containing protein [Trebonia sp.]